MRSLSNCVRCVVAPSFALRCVAQSPGRPQTVLSALLRLRHQQRGASPLSGPGSALNHSHEAMRLLRKEARGAESLSDVDVASVAFCVEVGKLLSAAAAFGATTTTPRVDDALVWVRAHAVRLSQTRQIMSIAMPLLNLRDGRVAGKEFVIEVLVDPLVTALNESKKGEEASEQQQQQQQSQGPQQPEQGMQQHRAAIVSVFQLVARVLEPTEAAPQVTPTSAYPSSDDVVRLSALLSAATHALLRTAQSPLPPMDAMDCAHVLHSCARLSACGAHSEASALLTQLLPLVDTALSGIHSARVADVSHLIVAVSQVAPIVYTATVERIARATVALLPPAISAATAKEMCAASQALTRLRASPAAGAVDAAAMRRFVDAARPKLFRLAETHAARLRHVECSLLLTNLTRLDAPLDDDIINLLCGAFATFASEALPAHIVPFLGAVARARPHNGAVGAAAAWESPLMPELRRCLDAAAERTVVLASAGSLSVAEAAQLLSALAQLQGPQCGAVYVAVEPMFEAAVRDIKTKVIAAESGDNKDNTDKDENIKADEEKDLSRGTGVENYVSLLSTLMHALDAFRSESLTASSDEAVVLERAAALHAQLRQCAALGVPNARHPKDLVVLMRLLAEEDRPGTDTVILSDPQSVSDTDDTYHLDAAAQRLVELAPLANAYEVGALARVTVSLCARGFLSRTAASSALGALALRGASVELTLHDAHALIDSLRRVAPEVALSGELMCRFAALLRATPERTVYLLRPLLPLLRRAPTDTLPAAVAELSLAAMSSTCALLTARVEPPPLRDLAVLAHMLAQLDAITRDEDFAPRDADNDNEQDAEGDGSTDADKEPEYAIESEHDALGESTDPSGGGALAASTQAAFAAIGDAASLSLQQQQQQQQQCGPVAITPRELVMLLQAFERAGPRGSALPYDLLPLARDMAPELGPLELSLLLNGFARLGVWNGRVLSALARGAAARVPSCGLRHCHAILQALHSAQCLRRGACALQGPLSSLPLQTIGPAAAATMEDSLRELAAAVVARMAELVNGKDAVCAVMETHDANEIAGAARALAFFDPPPQPALDTYIALAVRRATVQEPSGHAHHASSPQNSRLFAAGAIAPLIVHLRREDHRRVSARAIAALVDDSNNNNNNKSSSSRNNNNNSDGLRQEHYEQLLLLPVDRIAALYHWRCAFAALHGVDFAPAAAAPLLAAAQEKLRKEEITAQSRIAVAVRQLTRFTCAPVGDAAAACRVVADAARRLIESSELRPATAVALLDALMDADSVGADTADVCSRLICAALSGDTALLSPNAAATVLAVATANTIANASDSDSDTVTDTGLDAKIAALQRMVLVREQRLSVRAAVSLLLAGARADGPNAPEAARGAARRMASRMGRDDRAGLSLLPELYRLAAARGGQCVAWAAGLEPSGGGGGVREVCERVPAALLRAQREAKRNMGPSLSAKCRADVVRAYVGTGWEGAAGLAEILAELSEE